MAAASFADVRQSDHLRQLREHSVGTIKVGIVAAEFMRKKSALQEKYAADLNALVENCRMRTQASQQTGVEGFEDTQLLTLWDSIRTLSTQEATNVTQLSERGKATSAELTTTLTCKKRLMKMVFNDVQELERGVKSLEQTCEKSRLSLQSSAKATATAAAKPTGYMKKIADSKLVGGIFSKLSKERLSSKEQNEAISSNDYAMQVISANAQTNKFYSNDLPKALESAQMIYVGANESMKKAMVSYATDSVETHSSTKEINESLVSRAKLVDGQAAAVQAVGKFKSDATPSGWSNEVQFRTPDGTVAKPVLKADDPDTTTLLKKRLGGLEKDTTQLATDMSKQVKSVDGIERLYQQYLSTPSFGSPDEVFEKLYLEKKQVRNILTLMQRNNAVVAAIQDAGVALDSEDVVDAELSHRAIVTSSAAIDGEEDWDADDGDENSQVPAQATARQGLALYDYTPQNSDVGDEIALVAGEIISEIEEVDAHWSKGRVANRYGLFPASYCHFFYGDPAQQVVSMYDYTAANDSELSISADEVVAVVEPDDHGWTLVLREKDNTQGLVPSSYLDKNFVKLPQSMKAEKAGVAPSTAIAGFLDDLDGETEDIDDDIVPVADIQQPASFSAVTEDVGSPATPAPTDFPPAPPTAPEAVTTPAADASGTSTSSSLLGARGALPTPRAGSKTTLL